MVDPNSLWLVKSGGRVLGPFTMDKVTEMLRSREVSLLDEVAAPLRRWQTIQYHIEYKEVIDELRKTTLRDTTDPTWSGTASIGTSNRTQTITTDISDDLTDDLSAFVGNQKEIVVHSVKEELQDVKNIAPGRFQTVQAQRNTVQRKADKTANGLWVVTFLVLLGVAFFVVQKRFANSVDAPLSASDLKASVIANIQTGQYQEALRLLKGFYPDPYQSGEMAIYYGSLLIQLEGQTTVGRRLLASVVATRKQEAKQAYTGLGLADILDGQHESALANFNKAIAIDASFTPAISNLAALALIRGEYSRAKALAIRSLEIGPNQGEAILTYAQAQLYLFKSKGNANDLNQISKVIHEYLDSHWDFFAEIGLYGLYFDFLRKDNNFDIALRDYLDRDPDLTTDHRHNVFLYRGHTQWRVLGRFCEQLAEKLGETARVSVLAASCMAHELRWDIARINIEKAVRLSSRDELAQSWFSYVLKKSGDPDQASVVLARSNELNRKGEYVLPALLQGRFCQEKGDYDCARESWKKIYEGNLRNLNALSGMAEYHAQRNSNVEAASFIKRGLQVSSDYIPLLVLKQRGERDGWYVSH